MRTLANRNEKTMLYTAEYKGSAVYGAYAHSEEEAMTMMQARWSDASDYELECYGVKRDELGYCYAPCVWSEASPEAVWYGEDEEGA